jgi:hypothetical protein
VSSEQSNRVPLSTHGVVEVSAPAKLEPVGAIAFLVDHHRAVQEDEPLRQPPQLSGRAFGELEPIVLNSTQKRCRGTGSVTRRWSSSAQDSPDVLRRVDRILTEALPNVETVLVHESASSSTPGDLGFHRSLRRVHLIGAGRDVSVFLIDPSTFLSRRGRPSESRGIHRAAPWFRRHPPPCRTPASHRAARPCRTQTCP